MVSKVNLKARIERHSRILKDNLGNIHPFRSLYHRFNYNTVLFLVVFLFPIYPLFSSFFYDNSVYDFYRGDIDETSIIDSYNELDSGENSSLISNDSFLSVNTLIEGDRDISGFNEVIEYEVKSGDSLSVIASKFGISNNSILWANNFDSKKILHPGEKIKIPPVSGLIHQVKSGDTISQLAKKYKIPEEKILAQNGLSQNEAIKNGQTLIIPGAIKEVPVPPKKIVTKTSNTGKTNKYYSFTQGGKSEFTDSDGVYELVKRAPQWSFAKGNCTRFVAQYKNVNWSGNAREWLKNAAGKGHSTGNSPGVGAIVVFNGKGYNPRYGHVGIVVDVTSDNIIVKDMNYRGLYEVTVRKVPINDRAIQGYIYVD